MIAGCQLRAARALLNLDRKQLADLSGLSLQTIQRMESAEDVVGGKVESLMKVVETLESLGIELINDDKPSQGHGRGVRLMQPVGANEVSS